jgi:hypothetical protein
MSDNTNNFNCSENKSLLWEMLQTNGIFSGIDNSHFNNVQRMFDNIVLAINNTTQNDISNEQLLELNKQVILQIKSNIDIFKRTNNVNTVNSEKVLIFDKSLESAKTDFDKLITPKIPEQPEFKLQEDTPLGSENMNAMLEKLQRDRESLIPPPPSPLINDNDKTNVELDMTDKNTQPLKKLNNIEDLFKVSNLQDDSYKSEQPKSDKRVSFNSLHSILKHEYNSENKTNESIKISRVFELLTEINNKQDQIINLLQSER